MHSLTASAGSTRVPSSQPNDLTPSPFASREHGAGEVPVLTRSVARSHRQARSIVDPVAAYDRNSHRLLRDLGDHLSVSFAYIDRATVEAHLERPLSNTEWASTRAQFTALDFDENVGDHGTFRTDWIESLLDKAGVPGYRYTADGQNPTHDATVNDHYPLGCLKPSGPIRNPHGQIEPEPPR